MTFKVALSAGHHNSDGGSSVEYGITGPLCEAYAAAFTAAGCDVRVITPDGPDADNLPGDGMFGGGLQDVAMQVVKWANSGWKADLFLEIHTQAGPRGVFAIYPDWGNDIDQTVKNGLGVAMVKAISAASGLPVWSNGLMSEKQTGVGLSGWRLGVFLITAQVAGSTTRLIIEHGAHTDDQDLAILKTPGTFEKIAKAAVNAALAYFGVNKNPMEEKPSIIVVPETGKLLGGGFKAYFDRLNSLEPNLALMSLGYPITDEFECLLPDYKKHTVQLFERGGLIYEPENPPNWDIHPMKLEQLEAAIWFAQARRLITLKVFG